MKSCRPGKELIKTVILLTVIIPYFICYHFAEQLPGTDSSGDDSTHQYQVGQNIAAKFCLVPQNASDTILPERFVSLQVQKIKDHNFKPKILEYFTNNVLASHHPISVYKISLGAYTSAG